MKGNQIHISFFVKLTAVFGFLLLGSKSPAALYGQQVFFDQNFGDTGTVILDIDDFDEAIKVVADPTGNASFIVGLAGHQDSTYYDLDMALVKLDVNGIPDPSFGVNGVVKTDFGTNNSSTPVDMILQPDGKIVVLGRAYHSTQPGRQAIAVSRFMPDGSPDLSFGNNGCNEFHVMGFYEEAYGMTIDPTGNMYLIGTTFDSTLVHNELPAIIKIKPDGNLDTSFGGTGKIALSFLMGLLHPNSTVYEPMGNTSRHASGGLFTDVEVLDDGSILCGGYFNNAINLQCLLVKFLPNGTLDSSFADSGSFVYDIEPGYDSYVQKIVVRPDGMLHLGVELDCSFFSKDFYVVTTDVYLNQTPQFNLYHLGYEEKIKDLALQPDGKLMMTGYASLPANYSSSYTSDFFALSRLHADGISMDFTFNSTGNASWYYELNSRCGVNSMTIQGDKKTLLAGFSYVNNDPGLSNMLISRLDASIVGVEEETALKFRIYPNPASEYIYIDREIEGWELSISDIRGNLVKRVIYDQGIYIGDMKPGMYFLTCKGYSSKFLKF